MKILFVSQIAEEAVRIERGVPRDKDTMPAIFAGLGVTLTVVDATTEALPDPTAFDGVIVGGSLGSANDTEPWRLRLLDWVGAVDPTPFFGICGGHQLYARARGGEVAPIATPQGGVFPLTLADVPEFGGAVIQAHGEAVVKVPDGAEVWAADDACVQALRYGPTTWTTQFHPEFDDRLARFVFGLFPEPQATERATEAVVSGKALLRAWLAAIQATKTGCPGAA